MSTSTDLSSSLASSQEEKIRRFGDQITLLKNALMKDVNHGAKDEIPVPVKPHENSPLDGRLGDIARVLQMKGQVQTPAEKNNVVSNEHVLPEHVSCLYTGKSQTSF